MMQTLLKMVLLPPDLLWAHAHGYVDLSREVGMRYMWALKSRWVMWGKSVLALMLALVFAGVALMLWASLPMHAAPSAWLLLALPAVCLMLSAFYGWRASSLKLPSLLHDLQAQMAMDLPARASSVSGVQGMDSDMTPSQRLAVSRARLAQALRDPAWLLLLQRWLEEKPQPAPSQAQAAAVTLVPSAGESQKDTG